MKLSILAPIAVLLLTATLVGADEVSDFERGFALRVDGKPRKALESFRKVRPGSTEYVAAQVQSGACLEDLGNLKEAEKTYLAVLAADPNNRSARRNLEHLGLVKALKTPINGPHPGKEAILHARLRALEAKDHERALQIFRMFRGLCPTDPRPLLYSALTMESRGLPVEAQAIYESMLRMDRSYVPARVNLVVLLLQKGDPAAARKALDSKTPSEDQDPRLKYLNRILVQKAPTLLSERASIISSQGGWEPLPIIAPACFGPHPVRWRITGVPRSGRETVRSPSEPLR
jgi:Flp pilus assembly protein TadD